MLLSTLKTYLKPYWGSVGLIVLLQLISTGASLYLPSLNARIIDEGVAKGDTATIWSLGAIMLGVSAIQILCQITAIYFGARTAMGFGRDLRAAIFDRVLSFSAREVNQFGAPSLITRTTNDVQQVQTLVMMTAFMIVQAPIMMVGGLFMALRENVGLSWLIAVAVIVMGGIIGVILMQAMPLFRQMQGRIVEADGNAGPQQGRDRAFDFDRPFTRADDARQALDVTCRQRGVIDHGVEEACAFRRSSLSW